MRKTISCLVMLLLSTGCTLILDTDNTGRRCSDPDVTCEPGYFCNYDNDICEKENGQTDGGLDGEDGADGADGADEGKKPNGALCDQNAECDSDYCGNGICCMDYTGGQSTVCCHDEADCTGNVACEAEFHFCYNNCFYGEQDTNSRCAEGYHCDDGQCNADVGGGGTCDENSDCASSECINLEFCCEHIGLCCQSDDECPDLFSNCSGHYMYTCVYMTYNLPDTGQAKCYTEEVVTTCPNEGNAYYGQDAQHAGSTRTYTVDGNSVIDEVTGLRWWRAAQTTSTWDDANDDCDTDNTDGLAWRLPKRHELQTLVDYGVESGVLIDSNFEPSPGEKLFWTSTAVSGDGSLVWVVDFQNGFVEQSSKIAGDVLVRCVGQL